VVFIAGMEDEVFPSQKADFDTSQLEEERRLCYVAITRAEKTLYICHANERFVYGQTQFRSRSRFLEEIPPHLLESKATVKKADKPAPKKSAGKSVENFNPFRNKAASNADLNLPYSINERVTHKKFGLGIVRSVSEKTIEVEFTAGKKKFLTAAIDKFIQKA